jgi:hypothetical protein
MTQKAVVRQAAPAPAPNAKRPADRPILAQRFSDHPTWGTAAGSAALLRGALAEPGDRLDGKTRAFMEPRFGHDFSQVRVHADASATRAARALNAKAFTVGDHIFLGAGQSAAGASGRRLLAHELTHVTQQRRGAVSGVPGPGGLTVSDPGDAFERSAERTADAVMAGRGAATRGVEGPRAAAPLGAAVAQRFLAGDDGHGGVEENALERAGFSHDEAHKTYFGNWLRDYSQQVSRTGADDGAWFEIIQILATGEFGRNPTREELGRYLPSEHMDNPEGGDSAENPGYTENNKQDPRAEHLKRAGALSKSQQAWLAESQVDAFKGDAGRSEEFKAQIDRAKTFQSDIEKRSYISALPDYIERGKVHAMRQIQQAASLGRNAQGFEALGNGLHAVEDYFAHSNFVEVALAQLVGKDRTVAADNPSFGATKKYPGVDWEAQGTLNGQPRIVTGTSLPGPGDTVGTWEVIKTELRSGELRKLFIKGVTIRYGWTPGKALGAAVAHEIGAGIGGAVGAVGGAVGGLVTGAGRGAAEGWRNAKHWWQKPFAAVGGLFKGAGSGLVSGGAAGAKAGARVGGRAGDVVLGHVLGPLFGGVMAVAKGGPVAALILALSGVAAPFEPLFEAIARSKMKSATKETYTGEKKTKGLTHSQIAKDDPDHRLHAAAADLADFVDEQIGREMIEVWAGRAKVEKAMAMVDTYVAHPAKSGWWQARLAAFVNKP